MKAFAAASILVVLFVSAASAQTWDPELQLKVKAVGAPRVSPDGSRVVYTVNEAVTTADKSEFVTQIWMANIATKQSTQLTFGDKSSTNPKWSPDGKWIAFQSNRKDNRNNLYRLSLDGGEAEPLTELKSGVINFNWSPDGRYIAYTMTDPKTEEEEKNDKGRNDFRWVDENVKLARLYVVPVAKDANGRREARKLTTANYHVGDFDWSADSSRIAFSHSKSPVANDWTSADVSIVEVANANVTTLANTAAAEDSPVYSPDGKFVAITASDNPPRWAQAGVVQIYSANGGQPKNVMASFDGQPGIIGWSGDSKRIYFAEAKGTGTQLYVVDIAANRIDEIKSTPAVLSAISLNRSGTTLGFVRQSPDTPPDAFVASVTDFAPVQISRANADLKLPAIGRTEVIRWKSKDGKEIEGLLTYPVGYQAGQRVPLILNIHGGPAGVFQQTFLGGRGAYPLATFAARGYAILRPNPRGSSGYGVEFRRANTKDWGFGDYQDLMTGVDKVIEMGVADPDRLGVMGWSYGGFMTSWIVTQTNRFKAASAGAPVTNLMSFNGTADIPSFVPDYFGGQFWEAQDVYQKHSPMFNVKAVMTPTMIQHGEADIRVPISQGYEFYNALKVKGVPTRMLVLPRQPHGPNEPKMQLAAMNANLEWFEKYIGGKSQTSRNLSVAESITLDDLRRYTVARNFFKPTNLKTALHRMGFVQADPIRAPARAQDLILRHRVTNYRAGELERRYPTLDVEEDFFVNYGYVSRALYSLMHPRVDTPLSPGARKRAQMLLDFVRERGSVHPREVDEYFAHGKVTNYWGGSSNATTHLMDAMHYRGMLRVLRREKGIRIYAPREFPKTPISAAERRARVDALVGVVVGIYGPLPASSLTYYVRRLRYAVPQWKGGLTDALKRAKKRLRGARVGVDWYFPADEDPLRESPEEVVRLLAPFDPVVHDRARFTLLWDWEYRFEAYTPVAKRKLGYYAMPLLWRDRIVGWANVSVNNGALACDIGYVGSQPREPVFKRELEGEIDRLRRFLGLE